jgi:hypothetical protein
MSTDPQPLMEIDRFFPRPRTDRPPECDAQSEAVERFVLRCAVVHPHLRSAAALERFIRVQHDPARVRRRIALALAIELAQSDLVYGQIGIGELEMFRSLARRRLPSVVWVFA